MIARHCITEAVLNLATSCILGMVQQTLYSFSKIFKRSKKEKDNQVELGRTMVQHYEFCKGGGTPIYPVL